MRSKKPSNTAPFPLDLPTSPRDVEALKRARSAGERPFAETLARLSTLNHLPIRESAISKGWQEFKLP
jgi:hypothetical protein